MSTATMPLPVMPIATLPSPAALARHLQELEEVGFTVIPGFLDLDTCARLRAHADSLLPALEPEQGGRDLRHPIAGSIMAEMITDTHLELARQQLHARELRLTEQVLIRTGRTNTEAQLGWHIDGTFYPQQRHANPRQTYVQNVHLLSDLEVDGGGTMIVPGSHLRTYAAAASIAASASSIPIRKQAELKAEVLRRAEIDTSRGVQIVGHAGDLLLFDPMCLHCASPNRREQARYVFFQSFYDASATDFHQIMEDTNYRSGFPESLRLGLPEHLRSLLMR